MNNIAAFVPAREGSKRTPNKNLQPILQVPLFLWAANNLNRILPKESIFIDSNSERILSLAQKHGFNTIQRPESLATNATDGNKFMLWEVSNVDADIYIQHLPPMAFLKQETLELGLKKVLDEGYDSAFGTIKEHLYQWKDNQPLYDIKNIPNSFNLEPTVIEGMGLYIIKRETILENKTRIGKNPFLLGLDRYEAIDIDYPTDLEFARNVAKGLGYQSPYTSGIKSYIKYPDIKFLVLDVDGTMTDGGMYFADSGDELKKFNTKDGRGIINAINHGIKVGFLSSGVKSNLIKDRAKLLGVDYVYVGNSNKMEILLEWVNQLGIGLNEVAFIGDDINDSVLAGQVGVFACPADAVMDVKSKSDLVLDLGGGKGCIREFIELHLI